MGTSLYTNEIIECKSLNGDSKWHFNMKWTCMSKKHTNKPRKIATTGSTLDTISGDLSASAKGTSQALSSRKS